MSGSFYRARMSSELRAIFDELLDLSDLSVQFETSEQNASKYSSATLHALVKLVVNRSHGRQMRSLCMLVAAAVQADRGRGYANFLWGAGAGRRDCCATYFLRALPPERQGTKTTFTASPGGIALEFAGTSHRKLFLEYKFMPLLACLLDFILRALGTDTLDELCQQLSGDDLSDRELDDCANALTRDLYSWLDPHVPSKHHQSAFYAVGQFFSERFGETFAIDQIDDESIYELWLKMSSANSEDQESKTQKKYTSAYTACLRFLDLVSGSIDLDRFENSLYIASGRGEAQSGGDQISAEKILAAQTIPSIKDEEASIADFELVAGASSADYGVQEPADAEELLRALSETKVNVMNNSHIRDLYVICKWPQWIEQLPLSYLRNEVFGSIIKLRSKSWTDLFNENAYESVDDKLKGIARQVDSGLAACFYLRERNDQSGEKTGLADFAFAQGKAALNKKRQGFQEALRGDVEAVDAFLSLEESLLFSKNCLGRTQEALSPEQLSDECYERDRRSFTEQLELIFGDHNP